MAGNAAGRVYTGGIAAQPATVEDLTAFLHRLEHVFRRATESRRLSLADLHRCGFGNVHVEMTYHDGRFTVVDMRIGTKIKE